MLDFTSSLSRHISEVLVNRFGVLTFVALARHAWFLQLASRNWHYASNLEIVSIFYFDTIRLSRRETYTGQSCLHQVFPDYLHRLACSTPLNYQSRMPCYAPRNQTSWQGISDLSFQFAWTIYQAIPRCHHIDLNKHTIRDRCIKCIYWKRVKLTRQYPRRLPLTRPLDRAGQSAPRHLEVLHSEVGTFPLSQSLGLVQEAHFFQGGGVWWAYLLVKRINNVKKTEVVVGYIWRIKSRILIISNQLSTVKIPLYIGISAMAACKELWKWKITEYGNSDTKIIVANQLAQNPRCWLRPPANQGVAGPRQPIKHQQGMGWTW